ncbi:hypothetical protein RRF57_009137 [Xylaria bambusicola]|uniref:Uncharacterized protein n=1 Tax=Xylaria bambusicola TaxID=326684 RepID=A0AAN7UUG4_9PEZI
MGERGASAPSVRSATSAICAGIADGAYRDSGAGGQREIWREHGGGLSAETETETGLDLDTPPGDRPGAGRR